MRTGVPATTAFRTRAPTGALATRGAAPADRRRHASDPPLEPPGRRALAPGEPRGMTIARSILLRAGEAID